MERHGQTLRRPATGELRSSAMLSLALVEAHGVTGFRAHDARLVAAMQGYGLTQILTFNLGHFRGLPVAVLDPALVAP